MQECVINCLKRTRKEKGLTQEELAQKVGVTRQTIISIEKGSYTPSVLLALRLAKALDTTVEILFYE